MNFWTSLVGKLWATIICLVACILIIMALFLLPYIDTNFSNNSGDIKRLFTYTAIIGFSMTTFFALFLLTKITQPMQKLISATEAISKGEYSTRLSIVTSDEIGKLANTLNHMATELEDNIRNLNQEKEHLASVLRSMSDAVITIDNSGHIILTNPPAQKLIPKWKDINWDMDESEELEGPFEEKVPKPLLDLFERMLQESADVSADVHVKQGVWSVHMAPLYADNDIRGAVAVVRDITEQVKLEKMRQDFVANVSHEIRTPLSMMQGYSEALLDGMAASPEESEELIQVIHDESLRMGRLVKDLLDLARMEAGHTDIQRSRLDVNELLERVYRKFSVRAKENAIELSYSKKSDDLFLEEADEDKLEQVLTNLLDNAFRHTPEGKQIRMVAERVGEGPASDLQIKIEDEGAGIPQEDIPFVFERFYKADKARVRGGSNGTGLGLAIVKSIVESHSGSIRVTSQLGEGTIFSIRLPVESHES
ncbi:ATP-binding protein [Paenibacillus dokdonensis]|uniref:histidine kinase n=1 Tax=Paenibacillus dokdonensis TaxID=2567944 RepID=A0ABU6GUI4_9BACL|nr:ATP-binding protein [Paenibacillus dokdonensis]MEC0243366.1 ATP-binding protein [Paenibacillus dokdonensis]